MALKKIFSRRYKDKITDENLLDSNEDISNVILCTNPQLKDFITNWIKDAGWSFEDFAYFLNSIEVKVPAELSDFNNCSFKCISPIRGELHISLIYASNIGFPSQIIITTGNETSCYSVKRKNETHNMPEARLFHKSINKDNKQLIISYNDFDVSIELMMDDSHMLELNISVSENDEVLKSEALEEYLLNLDSSVSINSVYEELIKILNFSAEDINKCDNICIRFKEYIKSAIYMRDKIKLKKGKLQEYVITKDKETFQIYNNGNWNYSSDEDIKISYIKQKEIFTFFMKKSINDATASNPSVTKRMKYVLSEISKLEEYIKITF